MPSFDVVSKVDQHELNNALDQANREVSTRFDFKDSGALYEIKSEKLILTAKNDFQIKQMREILTQKLAKRNVDTRVVEFEDMTTNLHQAKQEGKIKEGLDANFAKKIVKLIKDQCGKVQASIQGNQVRVTGKKKDDLQEVIAFLREQKLELPLQFENFRE